MVIVAAGDRCYVPARGPCVGEITGCPSGATRMPPARQGQSATVCPGDSRPRARDACWSAPSIYAPPTEAQLSRALKVDAAYPGLDLGLVDASVVALAEELGVTRLATRDVRDFSAVRLADGWPFDLVVFPSRPEPPKRRGRSR